MAFWHYGLNVYILSTPLTPKLYVEAQNPQCDSFDDGALGRQSGFALLSKKFGQQQCTTKWSERPFQK